METLTALLQRVSLDTISPLSLLVAFVAGVLSFISPCVLPLIPGYISFISGATMEQMRGSAPGAGAPGAAVATVSSSASRRVILPSLTTGGSTRAFLRSLTTDGIARVEQQVGDDTLDLLAIGQDPR